MKHAIILTLRLLLLVIALYAVSNALKELLLREDELISVVLLVSSNMAIAVLCWSVGCWRFRKGDTRVVPSEAERSRDGS